MKRVIGFLILLVAVTPVSALAQAPSESVRVDLVILHVLLLQPRVLVRGLGMCVW